jgi:diguanylate cyclase (GGDEF)-like protein
VSGAAPGTPAAAPGALGAALAAGALSAPTATGGPTAGGGRPRSGPGNGQVGHPVSARGPIAQIINVIPDAIWALLAVLAALAVVLGGTAIVAANRSRRRAHTIEAIAGLATTDSLTGVLNRGAFEQRLQGELARARRYARPLGVLTFDVEGLKAINDAHGHSAGDDVLRSVAGVLTQSIRDHDVCGRMGGDEYAVLVTEQDRAGTEKVLQRIAAQMPTCRADVGLRTPWGLSAGIATFPRDGEGVRELLDAADRRLYLSRGIRIEPVT